MLWACISHPDVDVAFASSDAVGSLLQTLKRQLLAEKQAGGVSDGRGGGGGDGGGAGVSGVGGEVGMPLALEAGRRFRAMDHLPQLLSTLYQRMK